MRRPSVILIVIAVLILLDLYVFQAIKLVSTSLNPNLRKLIYGFYWFYTAVSILILLYFANGGMEKLSSVSRNFLVSIVFVDVLFKLLVSIFLFLEDIVRIIKLGFDSVFPTKQVNISTGTVLETQLMNRSDFLSKTALVVAGTPIVALTYGIISGAYDYRVKRIQVRLPNLPKEFDGIKIGQLSDIHSGSFYNKKAVMGGVEMMLAEKPDLIFFTGDLVNNKAEETADYIPIFRHLKAPMGVFTTLGNHDYGDYVSWPSLEAKQRNLSDLKQVHKELGWKLLMNENVMLKQGSEQIAVLGIENFGAKGNFPKYGKLQLAHKNTQDAAVKLLLSHDPSHWDFEVRKLYPDIDLAFAGHTHGMQFGVDNKYLKWSPVQYMYKQWAGLYTEGNQHLYVNRGFGFLGYPGRVGILPEITIVELIKG
jgi:predicted MPP superfamily phosphohydrolase